VSGSGFQLIPARVRLVTLGRFEAFVNGRKAEWAGGRAGGRQLKRGLAYLHICCGRYVTRSTLNDIAGGRIALTPRRVVTGLTNMLHTWGMGAALVKDNLSLMLRRDTSWSDDTDDLAACTEQAQRAERDGDHAAGVAALEGVLQLCGGDYLAGVLDEERVASLAARRRYWRIAQTDALCTLARCSLALPGHGNAQRAYAAAVRASEIAPENQEALRLLDLSLRRLAGSA
jgi:hypothetical protein